MSDMRDTGDTDHAVTPGDRSPAAGMGMPPPDVVPVAPRDPADMAWYEDGGRKAALGVWAGTAVLAYAAMQVSGWFADWPFVALVVGAVAYFGVRGVAVVLGELSRRPAGANGDTDDDDWGMG